MGKIPSAPAKKRRTKVLLRKRVLEISVSSLFVGRVNVHHSPVDEAARLVRHSLLDHESGGQSGASHEETVDAECPGDSQAMDDGV